MGCNNAKAQSPSAVKSCLVVRSINISVLPVEIIYKFLDELDIDTIWTSLYGVSRKWNEILFNYNEYHLNLATISLRNFNVVYSHIRPCQITRLTLVDDEYNLGLLSLFLSRFSITEFVRLRTLKLMQINNEELMTQILIPLGDSASLLDLSTIEIINSEETYTDIFTELIMVVLAKPSIRRAYLELSYSRGTSNPLYWPESCSIRRLTFRGTGSVSFVRSIFLCADLIEKLEMEDLNFDEEPDLNNVTEGHSDLESENNSMEEIEIVPNDEGPNEEEHPHNELANDGEYVILGGQPAMRNEKFAPIQSTSHLKSLVLFQCSINMAKVEWLLQEIPTLKEFHLSTIDEYEDESILNGDRWSTLVSKMDNFRFVFSVFLSRSLDWSFDECLDAFRTPFWLEHKQWFVSLEKNDEGVILYSLPYLNDYYALKYPTSSFDYQSTAVEHSTLLTQSMRSVRQLRVDTFSTLKPQVDNAAFPRFNYVTHLLMCNTWSRTRFSLIDLSEMVNLTMVEELSREERVPTDEFTELLRLLPNLKSIRISKRLLDALSAAKFCYKKRLRLLTIDENNYEGRAPINVEPFCDMFPRIEHLLIPIDTSESCQYVLDRLKDDLHSVDFRLPIDDISFSSTSDETDDENEHATTHWFSTWIQQLPKQYRCHQKSNQVRIWLRNTSQ